MLRTQGPPEGSSAPGEVPWRYSVAETWADAAIHATGILLVIVGALVLIAGMQTLTVAEAAATAIYLATLACSIFASAAYNLWPVSRGKWFLRRLDHAAIYLLIAGTYTPFTVKAGMGRLLAFVWLAAGLGAAIKVLWPGRFDRLSIALYLTLAWSGVLVFDDLVNTLPTTTLCLIGAGGIVYTLGVFFHVWERLLFQNAIWHAFVLAAAAIHFAAVLTVYRA